MIEAMKRRYDTTGQLLKLIREAERNGVTRYKLCKTTGISSGNLSNLMHGRIAPNVRTVEKLADALGYTLVFKKD